MPLPESILIINPNSSSSMTAALEPLLADLKHPNLELTYYTAPSTSPASINDAETSALSASEALPDLLRYLKTSNRENSRKPRFSAYLIACYSNHPLTYTLREKVDAPVLNIFHASILQARLLARPFGIVTTGSYWVPVFEKATPEFLMGGHTKNGEVASRIEDFVGVRSTGLTAVELHSTPQEEVHRRVSEATADLVGNGAEVILMGCAGMSGMEEAVRAGARSRGKEVSVVDGVRAGVVLLEGLVRAQKL
ncbi:Asp/Glu/hydantoin racemase [Irpex rosettiformis]|uniref:Asp/Glu/hydantoin racemase n=1 Tax=Irpex rosettiformis TaxID=378272 RepID=A0ACB8U9A8_9APHY|nr:Asp/Glu/hydantoin racemase [Irpex rosettiformis]